MIIVAKVEIISILYFSILLNVPNVINGQNQSESFFKNAVHALYFIFLFLNFINTTL